MQSNYLTHLYVCDPSNRPNRSVSLLLTGTAKVLVSNGTAYRATTAHSHLSPLHCCHRKLSLLPYPLREDPLAITVKCPLVFLSRYPVQYLIPHYPSPYPAQSINLA